MSSNPYVTCVCGYSNKPNRDSCARCKASLKGGAGAGAPAAAAAASPPASPSKNASAAAAAAPASPAKAAASPAKTAAPATAGAGAGAAPAPKAESKAETKAESKVVDDGAEWTLYYWPQTLGRGEFVRLIFAATGTKFSEPYAKADFPQAASFFLSPTKPFFAVPAVRHRTKDGDFFLSQTAAITRYLAKKLDGGRLHPKNDRDEFAAESLALSVADFMAEGVHAWHAMDHSASYASQAKETQPFIDKFIATRLPKWATYFENQLKANNGGKGWFVGDSMTYVDLSIFYIFEGVRFQLPEDFEKLSIPLVKAFMARVEALPAVAAHVRSRHAKFSGTGPCT